MKTWIQKLFLNVQNINKRHQAPSTGAVNMLAAGLSVLDIFKFLGEISTPISHSERIGVWTHSLEIEKQSCKKNDVCLVCSRPLVDAA